MRNVYESVKTELEVVKGHPTQHSKAESLYLLPKQFRKFPTVRSMMLEDISLVSINTNHSQI